MGVKEYCSRIPTTIGCAGLYLSLCTLRIIILLKIIILFVIHILKLEPILIIAAPISFPATMKPSTLPTLRSMRKAGIAKGTVKYRNIYKHWLPINFHYIGMLTTFHIYSTLQLAQNAKTCVQANVQNLEIVENIVQKDGLRKYVK